MFKETSNDYKFPVVIKNLLILNTFYFNDINNLNNVSKIHFQNNLTSQVIFNKLKMGFIQVKLLMLLNACKSMGIHRILNFHESFQITKTTTMDNKHKGDLLITQNISIICLNYI